ncbi:MAG: peptidoglycan DD-metalloendopeptidase family protein [Hyphomonadaceae bacterium]|nr:peptidoglycan DD-metalloendopeptidase family protein [Hyphomonadaceae bacterium]
MRKLAAILLLLAMPAAAQQQGRETFTQDDLKRVEKERDEALKRLRALERASKAAERETSAIDEDLLAAADATRREEAANNAELRLIDLPLSSEMARDRLTSDNAALEDLLASLMTFGSRRPPALAASPDDSAAAVRAAILMSDAAPALSGRARTLKAYIDELNSLTEQTRREKETLLNAEASLSARGEEIAALAAEKRMSSSSLAAETATLRRDATRLAAEAQTLRDLLDGLAKAAPATPGLKPGQKPAAKPPSKPAATAATTKPRDLPGAAPGASRPSAPAVTAAAPLPPAVGTRRYRFGVTINGTRQEGLTLATRSGAQVIAPLDARVQYAGVFRTYGQMLILDVGGDVLVIVAGLDALYAETGQWVLAGEPIGRMADQKSPSPELYLEVRRSGQPVDPEKWLGRGA